MPPRPDGRAAIGSFIPCGIDAVTGVSHLCRYRGTSLAKKTHPLRTLP